MFFELVCRKDFLLWSMRSFSLWQLDTVVVSSTFGESSVHHPFLLGGFTISCCWKVGQTTFGKSSVYLDLHVYQLHVRQPRSMHLVFFTFGGGEVYS